MTRNEILKKLDIITNNENESKLIYNLLYNNLYANNFRLKYVTNIYLENNTIYYDTHLKYNFLIEWGS